jgi:hypothetical protein
MPNLGHFKPGTNTVMKKVVKRVRRQRAPRPKSLFDISDDEDEDEDEFEEIEVEELVEEPITMTSPVPMEVNLSSSPAHQPQAVAVQKSATPEKPAATTDSTNLVNNISDKISSENIHSQNIKLEDAIVEQEPQFVRVIEDSEVDDLLSKQIVGLNGNYDKTGAFREFHQTILVETYRGEDFHILPYTIIDF